MQKKSKFGQRFAFSLIELSIVILVIGILVIGITQGSRIMREAKLKGARSLTISSPVNSISNIIFWVDSASEKSFGANVGNGSAITTWYDLNPQNSIKNNATAAGLPTYTANVVNGLPVVRFEDDDGSNDFVAFNGSSLAMSNYTIFLVAARRSNQNVNLALGGTAVVGAFINLHVGFYLNGTPRFRWAHFSDGGSGTDYVDYAVPVYSVPIFQIHSMTFNSGNGRVYYENSIQRASINTAGAKTPLSSWAGASIGRFDTNYFDGDVAEVIIFNKQLSNKERQSVEQYLSQKWGIKLS